MLASRAAMEQFRSALPVKVRSLGQLPIRGRADGIDVVGLDIPSLMISLPMDLTACPVVALLRRVGRSAMWSLSGVDRT